MEYSTECSLNFEENPNNYLHATHILPSSIMQQPVFVWRRHALFIAVFFPVEENDYNWNLNKRRLCFSADTGAHLAVFITLHANFEQGWSWKPKTEGGRGREEPKQDGARVGRKWIEWETERRRMVWWQSCRRCVCTFICRQINHKMFSFSIKMLI